MHFSEEDSKQYLLSPGDLLVCEGGEVGRAAIWRGDIEECHFQNALHRIRPRNDSVTADWLLQNFRKLVATGEIAQRARGNTILHLSQSEVHTLPIVVPPREHQDLLLQAIQKFDRKRESATSHLTSVRRAVERFRQSVFAAASAGRLTTDWRENNQSLESATQLLDLIREVRRGTPRPIEPEEVDAPEGEETPPTWTWVNFGSVIGELRNGVSTAPAMAPPGIPILRISAVRRASVDLGDLRFLRDDIQRWMSFTLRDGDLLFTRYNGSISLLGVCGMVRGLGARTMLHPDKLMKVRFDHDLILPEYVEIFFASPPARARMTAGSVSSAGQQGISGATVKAQILALPPLEEQTEIVRRVSKMLEAVDGVERSVETSAKQLESSAQAFLAKAFRGDLFKSVIEGRA